MPARGHEYIVRRRQQVDLGREVPEEHVGVGEADPLVARADLGEERGPHGLEVADFIFDAFDFHVGDAQILLDARPQAGEVEQYFDAVRARHVRRRADKIVRHAPRVRARRGLERGQPRRPARAERVLAVARVRDAQIDEARLRGFRSSRSFGARVQHHEDRDGGSQKEFREERRRAAPRGMVLHVFVRSESCPFSSPDTECMPL